MNFSLFYFFATFLVGLAGIFVVATDRELRASLNNVRFYVPSIIVLSLVTYLVFSTGSQIARESIAESHEFWNGLEKEALSRVVKCHRDGACSHTYTCDTELVEETYYDSEGELKTRTVIKNHRCPYMTHEVDYAVSDTLGMTYNLGSTFKEDATPWRKSVAPPQNVIKGAPIEWLEAKKRIDSGNPGGTTQRKSYKNWVQVVQDNVYNKYSSSISSYLDKDLLPDVTRDVYAHYKSTKIYPVGFSTKEIAKWDDWVTELQRFNGHLGSNKKGDLHLVYVNSSIVSDPDDYSQALNAHWLDRDFYGLDTLSKNGIVVIFGVGEKAYSPASKSSASLFKPLTEMPNEGKAKKPESKAGEAEPVFGIGDNNGNEVKWIRVFTGMPEGNERLVTYLQSQGTVNEINKIGFFPKILDKEGFLGKTIIEGYNRVSMKNYEYLKDSIPVSTSKNLFMAFLSLFFSYLLLIVGFVVVQAIKDK